MTWLLLLNTALADSGERIIGTLDLPVRAHEARQAGIGEPDLLGVLDATKKEKLNGQERAEVLKAGSDAVKESGNIDNFGAFVQEQLAAGKRGKELSDAIHAEHKARGKGKPDKAEEDDAKGKPDKDDAKDKPEDKGKPDAKSTKKDKPDTTKGKPDTKKDKPENKASTKKGGAL